MRTYYPKIVKVNRSVIAGPVRDVQVVICHVCTSGIWLSQGSSSRAKQSEFNSDTTKEMCIQDSKVLCMYSENTFHNILKYAATMCLWVLKHCTGFDVLSMHEMQWFQPMSMKAIFGQVLRIMKELQQKYHMHVIYYSFGGFWDFVKNQLLSIQWTTIPPELTKQCP